MGAQFYADNHIHTVFHNDLPCFLVTDAQVEYICLRVCHTCPATGTHVAGTIASRTYGLAKATGILDVRVLSADGTGFTPGIVNAIEYAMAYVKLHEGNGLRYVIKCALQSGCFRELLPFDVLSDSFLVFNLRLL